MNKIKRIIIIFTLSLTSLLSFSAVAKADMATDNLNAITNPGAHPENPIAQAELDDEDNDNDNNQKTKEPKTNNENKEIKDNNEQKDGSNKISFGFAFFEATLALAALFAFVQMILCMVKY